MTKRTHCWHVAFMLTLSCASQSASSSCERVGSYLHDMSDGETCMAAARIADRLRLRIEGVEAIGGQRDESLIEGVVAALVNKNPFSEKSARARRVQRGAPRTGNISLDSRLALSNEKAKRSFMQSLPSADEDGMALDSLADLYKNVAQKMAMHRDVHAPLELDVKTREALQRVVSHRRNRLNIEALPAFVGGQKGVRSTQRQKMSDWMASDEGLAWKKTRDELWQSMEEESGKGSADAEFGAVG